MSCVHHWMVASLDTPHEYGKIPSTCRKCGETKDFRATGMTEEQETLHYFTENRPKLVPGLTRPLPVS